MADSATTEAHPPPTGGGTGVRLALRPPTRAVDRRSVAWWTVRALGAVLPPVLALVLLGTLIAPARFWLLLSAAVIGVPGLLYAAVMPSWRYRVHRWETTDDAVFTRAGWVWQQWRIAPLTRIQTVDTVRGPLQRTFGLATLIVTTASAAGAVRIDGLAHELARDLAEELTRITQAGPGDAT
ncbi:PH domain-containing protein [Streptomyces qinzhouensis]|uniref:PH domain-containing protein n=1 Tax=Streptomyces qinzhouensis TaxID=2599401 RepID=A0A5B8JL70_9ACTN|nr:PH domain-containing protein [Streptomyces qinzhouensis]QDY81304.1 PH domain-containing protein [Streptomyces qinzhouensis]